MKMEGKDFQTEAQVSQHLHREGYRDRFSLEGDRLKNLETGALYRPDDLRVVGEFRFEGPSNPGDEAIVFAVECADGRKGNIVSSYGTYADRDLLEFMDRVDRVES